MDTPFYSPQHYQPEDSIGYLMRSVLELTRDEIDRLLAPADLTNAQWIPLLKLYTGAANTAAELARHCRLDGGAMTRTLDRLEAKGLCQRQRSEIDRRVVHIVLTDAGKQAAQAIPAALCQAFNSLLTGFSPEEFAQLTGYLHRLLANAKNMQTATDL